jgi:hypothetical protein
LATPSSWRVCTGLRPSGCSWSSATIRRRMSPRGTSVAAGAPLSTWAAYAPGGAAR